MKKSNKKFSYFLKIAMMVFMSMLFTCACSKEDTYEELSAQSIELFNQARYLEAIKVAEEAVRVAEKKSGPVHINLARALNNLAEMYKNQGT